MVADGAERHPLHWHPGDIERGVDEVMPVEDGVHL